VAGLIASGDGRGGCLYIAGLLGGPRCRKIGVQVGGGHGFSVGLCVGQYFPICIEIIDHCQGTRNNSLRGACLLRDGTSMP
jgi:hypothetical protein